MLEKMLAFVFASLGLGAYALQPSADAPVAGVMAYVATMPPEVKTPPTPEPEPQPEVKPAQPSAPWPAPGRPGHYEPRQFGQAVKSVWMDDGLYGYPVKVQEPPKKEPPKPAAKKVETVVKPNPKPTGHWEERCKNGGRCYRIWVEDTKPMPTQPIRRTIEPNRVNSWRSFGGGNCTRGRCR